eukprot:TRINITY_DN40008_c0_g1_i1.p1 TRINITY_DN40008_c0_g1~~TRINITY_DN40008_c0_g1_i1.p1  ORF type:complete len:235 (-),score=40.57 TRINITY_DN40008_c0_g1_i1:205-909(-)
MAALRAALKRARRSPVSSVLQAPEWPTSWPFEERHFQRHDEQDDTQFYSEPRLVTHVDAKATTALTLHYKNVLAEKAQVLDLCSSWVSHYPEDWTASGVTGVGMNLEELEANPRLDRSLVQDLNQQPALPYQDAEFDVATCALSVDYLVRPLEVFQEVNRVLRPGGAFVCSFSNRCFPTKAFALWSQTNDAQHAWVCGSFFHYSGGWTNLEVLHLNESADAEDPLFVVQAIKAE